MTGTNSQNKYEKPLHHRGRHGTYTSLLSTSLKKQNHAANHVSIGRLPAYDIQY
jgi:hypothetical protein